jgi:hypothetical protein
MKQQENHPGCVGLLFMLRAIALALRGLREILTTQPPLLAVMQGGEYA